MSREAATQLRYLMSPLDKWRLGTGVDEIAINKPGEVWVRQNGRFEFHEIAMDYDDAYDIAVLAGSLNEQNVGDRHPLVGADLPDGERLQAVLPPCVPQGTVSLTIRLHSASVAPMAAATKRYNTEKWNRWVERKAAKRADYAHLLAAYDEGDVVHFFEEIVRLRFNPVLCGATGAGKTTMLNTLASIIDPHERIITIENALEIALPNHKNCVRLLYSHGGQSAADIGQKELLECYLRMRPDRGLVGELRDAEAAYLYVNEVMTGHPGSPSTLHGRDAQQAATRLFNLFKASDAGRSYSDAMIIQQLGMVVDAIIPFAENGGSYEIGEVWLGAEAERRGEDFSELLPGVLT